MVGEDDGVKSNVIAAVVAGIAGIFLAVIALFIFSYVYIVNGTNTLFMFGHNPGVLVTDKEDFSRIIYWFTAAFLLITLLVCGLVSAGKKVASGIVVFGAGASAVGLIFIFMFCWLNYRMNANTPGVLGNIADDLAKCCVAEFYNDPASKCPNYNIEEPIPCVAPYANLTREALGINPSFEVFFWGILASAALSIVIAVCGYFSVSGKGVLAELSRLLSVSSPIGHILLGDEDDYDYVENPSNRARRSKNGRGDSEDEEEGELSETKKGGQKRKNTLSGYKGKKSNAEQDV